MDLSTLTVAQLRDLAQQIPSEIRRREVQEKTDVLNELRAVAKARGYAIEDLLGKEVIKPKSLGGKVKVKYRHPENAEFQWTGRGRQPKWVAAWLAIGGTLEQLVI